jgi:L-aminopeptidase/D-esterase-like protein
MVRIMRESGSPASGTRWDAHDGLARSINPVHTLSDGDTLFALGTGKAGKPADMMLLSTLAAEVTAMAVVRAVMAASGITCDGLHWPSATDLRPTSTSAP